MTATLITVAAMESRIMKREKDFCPSAGRDLSKASRRAIKEDTFTIKSYNAPMPIELIAHFFRLKGSEISFYISGKNSSRLEITYF